MQEIVRWAASRNEALAVSGSDSRTAFGHAVNAPHSLSLSGLTGICDYDPRELVLTALAGTPLTKIESALAQQGQQLAFEPPCPRALFGSATPGTFGGVFLGNQSGPRRVQAGAARDHILGVRAVNGRGELWKSGGRVIKNVTGYDLSKLMAGSWGTLSVVTEITCKVLPVAPESLTLGVPAMDAAAALAVLSRLAGSALAPTGLAYVPHRVNDAPELPTAARAQCLIRFEASAAGIGGRVQALGALLEPGVHTCRWTGADSAALWRAIRDAVPVAGHPVIIRLSIPPALAAAVVGEVSAPCVRAWFMDAAGAWLWIGATAEGAVDLLRALRARVRPDGGSVVIMRAPEEIKTAAGVLTPPPPPLAALNRRLKESFDPLSLFNPGRLYPH
ncbi:MAG: FAD-binding protein [Gammaproteobacteria bacterium]|nr:FAD-binding protein [Gammaproteobacteria bacterium]